MQPFEDKIDHLLSMAPYGQDPEEREAVLSEILKEELDFACQRHDGYKNYVNHWPRDFRSATRVAELPFLPVGILKADPPLTLVDRADIKRTLTSSATTSQTPSRVVLDSATARRMAKGVVNIVRDYVGPTRRPYLVVDTPTLVGGGHEMGARGAAIQGLQPFANKTTHCLSLNQTGDLKLDREQLVAFAREHQNEEVLVYGFTFILWKHLVQPLIAEGICLNLPKARILHSGGWKRLQDEAVEKPVFNEQLARVLGCSPNCVIDFYGMVESVGIIYPDCSAGNKHGPVFGDVIVRDPLTLEPVAPGEYGVVQVCSVLPTSFPGHLLLTEDMAQVLAYDNCPCGRRGISFRFAGRIPKAEVRGCGNLESKRLSVA